MAVKQNWSTYEIKVEHILGWQEVSSDEVFENTIFYKIIEHYLDKHIDELIADYIEDNCTYVDGVLTLE